MSLFLGFSIRHFVRGRGGGEGCFALQCNWRHDREPRPQWDIEWKLSDKSLASHCWYRLSKFLHLQCIDTVICTVYKYIYLYIEREKTQYLSVHIKEEYLDCFILCSTARVASINFLYIFKYWLISLMGLFLCV